MTPLQELAAMLRPAGGGLYLVSSGKAEQLAMQQRLYGVKTPDEVQQRFLAGLEKLATARGVLMGVPSDVGAGFSLMISSITLSSLKNSSAISEYKKYGIACNTKSR